MFKCSNLSHKHLHLHNIILNNAMMNAVQTVGNVVIFGKL